MLPLVGRATRRAWQRASSCVRRRPQPLAAPSLGDVPACRRLSDATRTRAVSQNSSGGQQPWERASLATLAEEFSRAAEYEDHTGFDNVMGQRQRFSGFLHDLLSRAKQATARDQATYKAVAALAAEAQQYEALRVPERALLLVRPVLPRPCPLALCLTCAACVHQARCSECLGASYRGSMPMFALRSSAGTHRAEEREPPLDEVDAGVDAQPARLCKLSLLSLLVLVVVGAAAAAAVAAVAAAVA